MHTGPIHRHRRAAALAVVVPLALAGCSHVSSTREDVVPSPSPTPSAASTAPSTPASAPHRTPSARPRATPAVDPRAAILINGRPYPQVASEGLGAKAGSYGSRLADSRPVTLALGADLTRLAASPVAGYSVAVRPAGSASSGTSMCRFDITVRYATGGRQRIENVAPAYAAAHSGAWMPPSGDASAADQAVAGVLGIIPPNDASSMTTRSAVMPSTPVSARDSTMAIVGSSDHGAYAVVEACDGSSYMAPDTTLGMDPVASKRVIFPAADDSPFATATVDRNPESGAVSAYAVIDGAEQGDDGPWTRG
ncbi:hypothetical protein [Acidipropionibacterium acidipropionici]|uniref:hypothetical protein n=1 Tax=Acidipropionibacterium acidipropionici TaxID=1748 RepID=UPI000AE6755A|nr:hypothetical protein [Acidipropionibacterium acidipropionici]